MSVAAKIFNRLTFRCCCALCIGIIVVALFSGLLSFYGTAPETTAPQRAAQALKFPENEQMLNAVSDQLAREGAALSNVEPAAGGEKETAPQSK